MKMKFSGSYSALTPAVFYILFALRKGKKHGYDLLSQIKTESKGFIKLSSGTLYTCLKNLLNNKLIEEIPMSPEETLTMNVPRKYYSLTAKGRSFLLSELERFHEIIKLFYQSSRNTQQDDNKN